MVKPNPYIPDPYPDLPILAVVDLNALTRHQLHDYRLELRHTLRNAGIEFDILGDQYNANVKAYRQRIDDIKAILGYD